jgi:predicted Zn finger-like uncharacterized protein
MPINVTCPDCRATYVLADQQSGKKVRCKKCQGIFVAGARPAASRKEEEEPLDVVEVVSEPPPRPKPKPAAVTARRPAPPRPARDEEDEDDQPRRPRRDKPAPKAKKGSAMPWIITGVVGGVLLLGGGVVAVVLLTHDSSPTTKGPMVMGPPPGMGGMMGGPGAGMMGGQRPGGMMGGPGGGMRGGPPGGMMGAGGGNPPPAGMMGGGEPPPQAEPPNPASLPKVEPVPVPPPDPPVKPAPAPEPPPVASSSGEISPEAVEKVKRATVYIKVTMPDGNVASGTGFFGVPEARNIVLTNAHVVGMKSSDSARPQRIEVYINSGQPDEKRCPARVLGVDRASDLAVLDLGTTEGMPEPLMVKSAAGLRELSKVYTFGFPLGERLGKEFTVLPSSVS